VKVLHIASREIRSTFSAPLGWLVALGFLVLTGFVWVRWLTFYVRISEDMLADPYSSARVTLGEHLLGGFFHETAIVIMMLVPALSMRMYSEEIKQRTLELLLTSPISTAELVLGKFLGAVAVLALLLLGTLHGPLVLFAVASPDPGVVLGGYAGLLLMGSALLAMGGLASALTANQVVALVLSFSGGLLLYLLFGQSRSPDDLSAQISVLGHLSELLQGKVQLSDVVYFLAFTGVFLFATHQRMESFRWR
jgi:ABC-2 type transport system permease protein